MEKGINLSLTKSLAKFDALLDRAIEEATLEKLSAPHRPRKPRRNSTISDGIFSPRLTNESLVAQRGLDGLLNEAEIDALLSEMRSADLPATHELNDDNVRNYRVGKYVKMESDKKTLIFWIGYGWEKNEKSESCLWLEFDAKHCPAEHWQNLYKLVGTFGKYYPEVGFEFAQVYMNAWIHFCLREEYLKQFYDENAGIDSQREILTGFINEVVEKL